MSKSKPRGYWKDWENVEKELLRLTNQLGHFPTQKELHKLKKGGLADAIIKRYSGLNKVRKRMGYAFVKRPNDYWSKWNNIKEELNEIIKELGYFPSQKEMNELDRSYLVPAINQHGGMYSVRDKMGYESKRKPDDYWKEWKNVETRLNTLVKKLGHFPNTNELRKRGNSPLNNAITRHHGGLAEVRGKMGYKDEMKPRGYWEEWKNVEKELSRIIIKSGDFPTQNKLIELNFRSLIYAIYKHHGGMAEVRGKMGYKELKKKYGYWQEWKNVEKELKIIISQLGRFPTTEEIPKDLRSAIYHNHGTLGRLKQRMGYVPLDSKEDFISFLKSNKTARNLAGLAINLNGESYEVEKIIIDVYQGKFKDLQSLHKLLQENSDEVLSLAQDGIINLGTYLGEFSIGDKRILPVLLNESLMTLPENKITHCLEDRLLRMLRTTYSPKFNENPEVTLSEIKLKIEQSDGKVFGLYKKLKEHYEKVFYFTGVLNE